MNDRKMKNKAGNDPACEDTEKCQSLSEAAKRALAEAEERRRINDEAVSKRAKEVGGRDGLDPIRYGDWEKKGITSDF